MNILSISIFVVFYYFQLFAIYIISIDNETISFENAKSKKDLLFCFIVRFPVLPVIAFFVYCIYIGVSKFIKHWKNIPDE